MKNTRARKLYGDIIDLPHHQSKRHPHMSLYDRAAQFAPFAALSGYSDMVKEEARLTEKGPELSEDQRDQLDRRLAILRSLLAEGEHPQLHSEYFVSDERKSGGRYESITGRVKRVDMVHKKLVFLAENGISDGKTVPLEAVTRLHCPALELREDTE